MTHRRGDHDTWCDQVFCFDLACSFHSLDLTKNIKQGMNETYKCPLCGQTECTHTPPDLPDLVDTTPSPPRLYPLLPTAPPAELSDDSSVESVEESLRTTDAERARYNPSQSTGHSHGNGGGQSTGKSDSREGSSAQEKRETDKFTPTSGNSDTYSGHNLYNHNLSSHLTARQNYMALCHRRSQKTTSAFLQTKEPTRTTEW